jgi:hypothetical protein
MTHVMEGSTALWLMLLLGAYHGINPGMGWLFAVALGMQEQRSGAVWRALLPLGAGHALAVAAAILVAIVAGAMVPIHVLRWPVALILVVFAITRLVRHTHPRWVQMRVGMGGLMLWSFLMASAHGAGLMVVPVFLGMTMAATHDGMTMPAAHDVQHAMPAMHLSTALLATSLHAAGYLLVTATVAILVFKKFGLTMLRKAWFNVDLLWGIALIATGILTVVV